MPDRFEAASAADWSPEDPPYAPDSVFRPETHRDPHPPLPADALLARDVVVGRSADRFGFFGEAVGIDGDLGVVGAPYADVGDATDAGAVSVFGVRGSEWREIARLVASRSEPFDRFGVSVAVSRSTVVVGADRHDAGGETDAGAAYVFECGGAACRRTAVLTPGAPSRHAAVGYAVAIDGDTAVVGAPGHGRSGAVFVFTRHGGVWRKDATLTAPDPGRREGFGHAVAISGDVLAVGAPTANGAGVLAGVAYVFRRHDGWTLEAALQSVEPEALARFGAVVAIRGDLAVVGAPRATVGTSTRAGKAWVFQRRDGSWEAVESLTNAPPRSDEEFGRTLALSRRWAVIGSHFADAVGLNTGGAQLFAVGERGDFVRRGRLLAADARPMNELAFATAIDDRHVLMGAPRRGPNDDATGAAYVYRLGDAR